jgi:hypothetical protein
MRNVIQVGVVSGFSRKAVAGVVPILCAFTIAACATAPAQTSADLPSALNVGVAEIDITPDEPIRLTGYGSRIEPTNDVRQRLWARAMAFGDGRRTALLITADLVGVPRTLSDDVAKRLGDAGIDRAAFAMSATHTHTGPSLTGVLPYIFNSPVTPPEQAAVDRYTSRLTGLLEKVARAALADRKPSQLAWAQGRAEFAANRRVLKDGKWTGFGITPGGAVDHDLPILAVRGTDGSLRAVLISYACHATTLEGKDNFIHGDWPGMTRELIQKRHPGAIAFVAIGTGADANPNPRGGGLPDVEQNAEAVAAEVDRVLATPMRPVRSMPEGKLRDIALPLAPLPERAEWEARAKRNDPAGFQARDILRRLDRGERVPATASYPVQTWTFGSDLAMVFLGGEVVADYGLRLKRELDASRLWVNAYSNDVAFYVASRRLIPEGGYEVSGSMVYYGQPAPLGEGTEDLIVRTVRELLPSGYRAAGSPVVRWFGIHPGPGLYRSAFCASRFATIRYAPGTP